MAGGYTRNSAQCFPRLAVELGLGIYIFVARSSDSSTIVELRYIHGMNFMHVIKPMMNFLYLLYPDNAKDLSDTAT